MKMRDVAKQLNISHHKVSKVLKECGIKIRIRNDYGNPAQAPENKSELNPTKAPYKIYNIGNNNPCTLLRFIDVLEDCLGKKAIKNMLPLQPGDVPYTYADTEDLMNDVGYKPDTTIEAGIAKFVSWYKNYYENKTEMYKFSESQLNSYRKDISE